MLKQYLRAKSLWPKRASLPEAIGKAVREAGEQLAVESTRNAREVSDDCVDLIKRFEGCRLEAYPDPGTGGEPWTIGWGATLINGKPVRPGMVITQAKADYLLIEDIERHAKDVRRFLKDTPTTQGQFDALVSFHFNTGQLHRATLLRKHKAGDHDGAAREFAKWKFAGGRVLKGLVRRRKAEAELYRS